MPTNGNTTQRGYGTTHQKLRAKYQTAVDAGLARCWRCLENGATDEQARINPGDPWDLGHDDHDRRKYRGPEHVRCNRATKTRSNKQTDTSRNW